MLTLVGFFKYMFLSYVVYCSFVFVTCLIFCPHGASGRTIPHKFMCLIIYVLAGFIYLLGSLRGNKL